MPVDGPPSPPPALLREVITYLEMSTPVAWLHGPAEGCSLPAGLTIAPVRPVALPWYRALMRRVGEPWLWYERLEMSDPDLDAIVNDSSVEVRVMREGGALLGFAELDRRTAGEVEVTFFGLILEAIGRGLGRALMRDVLVSAWSQKPRRVWLHTCNFDHPGALAFYRRMGFRPYRQEQKWTPDPRLSGTLSPTSASHVPLAKGARPGPPR